MTKTQINKRKFAFSLVELSIVLVILGLLVGGVLSGQSLVRAAELRSITTQRDQFVSAVHGFKDKYQALPGDMPNATSFWSAAHTTPSTCIITAGTGTQTCNGNGDGSIATSTGSDEPLRFWQHLANAGLIEGNYAGLGSKAPSKFSNVSWGTSDLGDNNNSSYYFYGDYGHSLILKKNNDINNYDPTFLRPDELWNIDTKADDGKPATGKLVATGGHDPCCAPGDYEMNPSTCTDTSSLNDLNASYLLSSSDKSCALVFRKQF